MINRLSEDWGNLLVDRNIIVYGLGKVAKLYLPKIMKDFNVLYIIDNDVQKQGFFSGIPVVSFEEIEDIIVESKVKIILLLGTDILCGPREKVKSFLKGKGLKEYVDYCDIKRFAMEWYWRFAKRLNVFQVHTAITTRCTLKCKRCNMMIPYYDKIYDYTKDDIERNLDYLFKYTEYIFKYQLVGGEPFLNPELGDILELIGKKYNDRIAWKRIITNGTIVPRDDILLLLKKYDYDVVISDYTKQVDYSSRMEKLISKFEKHGISYTKEKNLIWTDNGLPDNIRMNVTNDNPLEHMKNCTSEWHGLVDGKMYYCNVAWSAEKCGIYKNQKSDFVDLAHNLDVNDKSALECIVDIQLGEMGDGINSLCKYCKGCGDDNQNIIPAGEQ